MLIGDSGVGKSNLLMRFTRNEFSLETKSTIGVEFATKNVNAEDKVIKAQIWDTAGQERFRTITTSYYRGAHAIVIVFDLTKRQTYEHIQKWMNDINRFAKENVLKFIIGNKSDLTNEKQVNYEEVRSLASQMKATYFNVSAKKNENINEFFEAATKIFLIKYNFYEEENNIIKLNKKEIKNEVKNKNKKGNKKDDKC